jgi:hypothetical protein
MWTYARCLPVGKQPGTKLIIKTVKDLIELAFLLIKGKGKNKKNKVYKCGVSKVQVEWLAFNTFLGVLKKRQSKYRKIRVLIAKGKGMCERIKGVVREAVD